ncbi:Na+/H+ antiporter NhaA [Cellulomonas timonensis]|uniref:Na+/H+ antiporter NhaA n=1 Tax=Cellulomonas timonensis TaxID=1689271 RepID=UPI00082B59EC|nr:Na+/H+ antiporter NhaA [Cellulomonas timonensis]
MPARPISRPARRLFASLLAGSERNLLDTMRDEKVGGVLLLVATVIALVWANSPWSEAYNELLGLVIGPASLHLDLTVAQWATDGLLAIFFFVVGLELKREIVVGELRRFSTAVVPAVAAVGGMLVPALVYVAVNTLRDGGSLSGWAVPTATDIAFAVAVLAVAGRRLPATLRMFLLTLAVVDDLLAIIVIAVFYTDQLSLAWLGAALLGVAAFGAAVRRRGWTSSPFVLLPLALLTWVFMHSSGVHATIAGVLLALTVPALSTGPDEHSVAEKLEHRWRPLSSGVAVPLFALCAAGVSLSASSIIGAIGDPVAQGVALGLVVGKPLGIVAATWLVARFTRATLAPGLAWWDIVAVGLVGGIGFTVSLLIGELAFGAGSPHTEHLKVAILAGSATAALVGGAALALRDRYHASTSAPRPEAADPGTPTG